MKVKIVVGNCNFYKLNFNFEPKYIEKINEKLEKCSYTERYYSILQF